jgi:hypothetical protein
MAPNVLVEFLQCFCRNPEFTTDRRANGMLLEDFEIVVIDFKSGDKAGITGAFVFRVPTGRYRVRVSWGIY